MALARALVYEPEILLLDEPLSNLDAKLREQMRTELKLLQARLGITMIFVTHDQVEALSLSDRLAVMHRGRVEQLGSPRELYERPRSAFVRDFLGRCVVLDGRVCGDAGARIALADGQTELVCDGVENARTLTAGEPVVVAVRPEDVQIADEGQAAGDNIVPGLVETLLFVGDRAECRVRVGAEQLVLYVPRRTQLQPGQTVALHFPRRALSVWPASRT